MNEVTLKIDLGVGPATIKYKAPEGARLFHIDEATFINKVMELMKYIGTEEEPPEAPPEPPEPRYPSITYSGFSSEPLLGATSSPWGWQQSTPTAEVADADEDDPFYDDEGFSGGGEEADVPTGGVRVGRVSGIKEVRAS